jgi:hypothetical protein
LKKQCFLSTDDTEDVGVLMDAWPTFVAAGTSRCFRTGCSVQRGMQQKGYFNFSLYLLICTLSCYMWNLKTTYPLWEIGQPDTKINRVGGSLSVKGRPARPFLFPSPPFPNSRVCVCWPKLWRSGTWQSFPPRWLEHVQKSKESWRSKEMEIFVLVMWRFFISRGVKNEEWPILRRDER